MAPIAEVEHETSPKNEPAKVGGSARTGPETTQKPAEESKSPQKKEAQNVKPSPPKKEKSPFERSTTTKPGQPQRQKSSVKSSSPSPVKSKTTVRETAASKGEEAKNNQNTGKAEPEKTEGEK